MDPLDLTFNDLKVKCIGEMQIPDRLQAVDNIISNLINSPFDTSIINKIPTSHFIANPYLLKRLSEIFPKNIPAYKKMDQYFENNQYIFHGDNCYTFEGVFHSVACDNLDDLQNKVEFESIDINQNEKDQSLIDIACMNGSEMCFKYLKLKGAKISYDTTIYAIQGGNKNIVFSLFNDKFFEITSEHLRTALKYHHNDIFDWLLETKGSTGNLDVCECFYYGNLKGFLFLLENGLIHVDQITIKYTIHHDFIILLY